MEIESSTDIVESVGPEALSMEEFSTWNGREVSALLLQDADRHFREFLLANIKGSGVFGTIKVVSEIFSSPEMSVTASPLPIPALCIKIQHLIDICKEYNEAKRLQDQDGMEAKHYELIKKISEKAIAGTFKEEDYDSIQHIIQEAERKELEERRISEEIVNL